MAICRWSSYHGHRVSTVTGNFHYLIAGWWSVHGDVSLPTLVSVVTQLMTSLLDPQRPVLVVASLGCPKLHGEYCWQHTTDDVSFAVAVTVVSAAEQLCPSSRTRDVVEQNWKSPKHAWFVPDRMSTFGQGVKNNSLVCSQNNGALPSLPNGTSCSWLVYHSSLSRRLEE